LLFQKRVSHVGVVVAAAVAAAVAVVVVSVSILLSIKSIVGKKTK